MFIFGSNERSEKVMLEIKFTRVLFECSSYLGPFIVIICRFVFRWVYSRSIDGQRIRLNNDYRELQLPESSSKVPSQGDDLICDLCHGYWKINISNLNQAGYHIIDTDICPNFVSGSHIFTVISYVMELPATQPKALKPIWIIVVLECSIGPGNSPILNLIECLWKDTKDEISQVEFTNKVELIVRLMKVWHKKQKSTARLACPS